MKLPASLAFGAIALFVGLCVVPTISSAQPAPSYTPVPPQRPDFSTMSFLTGSWACTQVLRGKTRPDTSTTTISMNGSWMVTQDVAPPFDQYRTFTINGTTYTTYDPTIKQWVQIGVDDSGAYFTTSSPGWQGNTMTWTGKGLDGSTGTDVVTKNSDTETTDQQTITDASGKPTTVTIHCTKSAN